MTKKKIIRDLQLLCDKYLQNTFIVIDIAVIPGKEYIPKYDTRIPDIVIIINILGEDYTLEFNIYDNADSKELFIIILNRISNIIVNKKREIKCCQKVIGFRIDYLSNKK